MLLYLAPLCLSRPKDVPAHLPDDRIRYFECFNIVRIIEHSLKTGSDESARDRLSAHCDKLRDVRSDICHALIPSQIENITDHLKLGERAETICEGLGYSRVFGASRLISKDKCVSFVELARAAPVEEGEQRDPLQQLPKPFKKLQAFGKDTLHTYFTGGRVCKDVPSSDRMSCHIVTRLVAKILRDEAKAGVSSQEICNQLQVRRLIKFEDDQAPRRRPGEERDGEKEGTLRRENENKKKVDDADQ
jgi:hypothetical protein